jgi:hypothetical protein
VDASGAPFLLHADTAWTIVKKLTPAQVDEYLDRRTAEGWNGVLVHCVSREQGPSATVDGHEPFDPPFDITRPHEPYWTRLDHVIAGAARRGMLVGLSALWIRWGGTDREGWRAALTPATAATYGRFLASRYRRFDNIMWILGGDANPWDRTEAIEVLARTLHAGAPRHLVTYHASPENASAAFFHGRPWLGANLAYTYQETHRQILGEWTRAAPRRPIFLGESGYEEESNDKRGGSPARVRRQLWGAFLSGALGGHAYGHRAIWRFAADWRPALDAPGARHARLWRDIVGPLPWWTFVPDQSLVAEGGGPLGDASWAAAARSADGRLALVYLPAGGRVTPDLRSLRLPLRATWIDPTDGSRHTLPLPLGDQGRTSVLTPPTLKNAAGDADFVLLLEAETARPGAKLAGRRPAQPTQTAKARGEKKFDEN